MTEKVAKAITSFTRSDLKTPVKRGEIITGEAEYIEDLARVGNVIETKVMPDPATKKSKPAGTKSSASQAGQASQRPTSTKSKSGVSKAKSEL